MTAALEFCEVLAEAFSGLVQSGFHHRELVLAHDVEARAQIALGNAPGKSDHALQPRGDSPCGPCGEGQRNGQRNEARPHRFAIKNVKPLPCRVLHETAKDQFHRHRLKGEQKEEQTQELCEYFARQLSACLRYMPARGVPAFFVKDSSPLLEYRTGRRLRARS